MNMIIAATFNVQRDRARGTPQKLRESSVVVGLMQKRLREQVNELLTNFAGRVGDQAERFKKITDFLKQSIPEMQTAEGKLYLFIAIDRVSTFAFAELHERATRRTHVSLREHLATLLDAYNFAKRLKSLCGLTPVERICQLWTEQPQRFRLNPLHHIPELNI